METLIGAALGGVTRLAPEILSFFDRKNEALMDSIRAQANGATSSTTARTGF